MLSFLCDYFYVRSQLSKYFHVYGFVQPNNLVEVDRIGFIIPILKMIKLNLGEITIKKDRSCLVASSAFFCDVINEPFLGSYPDYFLTHLPALYGKNNKCKRHLKGNF